MTVLPRSWIKGPHQGFGGDLDHALEMQRQPHSVHWTYAAVTCKRPGLCLRWPHDPETASHSISRRAPQPGGRKQGTRACQACRWVCVAHTHEPSLSEAPLCLSQRPV